MSKTTKSKAYIGPTLIGGLLVAAGIVAAVKLTRKEKLCDSADAIITNCEHALEKLVKKIHSPAA